MSSELLEEEIFISKSDRASFRFSQNHFPHLVAWYLRFVTHQQQQDKHARWRKLHVMILVAHDVRVCFRLVPVE